MEAVAVTVKELVSYALTLNPNNQSWLITQADIYFGKRISEASTVLAFRISVRKYLTRELCSGCSF